MNLQQTRVFTMYRILGVLGIVLALAASASAGPAITTGLMAYYGFDDAGNITADGSGHGYNGTIPSEVTGVTPAAGKIGGAVNFDNYRDGAYVSGAAPDYMDLPGASMNPSGLTNFSFAGYFKPSGQKWDSQWMIISGFSSQAQTLDNAPDTQFRYYAYTGDNSIQVRLRKENGDPNQNIINQKVNAAPLTEWAHWAFTYDKSGGENAFNMYCNGANVYSGPLAITSDMMGSWTAANQIRPLPGHESEHQTSLRLGAAANDQTLGYGGLMDEVYLFNQTLTANQINTLYNVGNWLQGDANMDLTVNVADLTNLLNNYNKTGMVWANGDFNGDTTVNVADLTLLLNNYNKTFVGGGGLSASSAVPEPSSLVLSATLSALLAAWVIRRRNG
jgi:hypothetical protein